MQVISEKGQVRLKKLKRIGNRGKLVIEKEGELMIARLREILKKLELGRTQVMEEGTPLTGDVGIVYKREEDLKPLIEILEERREKETLSLKGPRGRIIVSYSQVILLEKVDKKTYFYTDRGEGYTYEPLNYYERELYSRRFVRINKSQIVNFSRIERVIPMMNRRLLLELDDESSVEVSRGYRRSFDQIF